MPGVTGVLIVVEPRDGGYHDRARFAGKVAPGSVQEVADGARRIACATLERCGRGSGGFTAVRGLEARREGGEAAVDPDLAAADRRLERRARKRERPGSRKRAEQHRAQEASRRVRKRRHVECHEFARGVAAAGEQRCRVLPPIGERDLLGHGEDAVGGGDEQGLVRVTKPRSTARAASISSEASTTSTSPGTGISASTGSRPSACALGNNST